MAVINDPRKPRPVFRDDKVWVKIMVYRPKHPRAKGKRDVDPINFEQSIADAIKWAIKVDDDMYSSVVDWEVDVDNPRIEITVEQGVK